MRNVAVATALLALAALSASLSLAVDLFRDDFEDGNYDGWYTWLFSGTTPNAVGDGFILGVEGDPYNWTGDLGLHLHRYMPEGTGDIAEVRTQSGIGLLYFCFYIRPFVTGGTDNSQIVWLSEVSGQVSETGSSNLGVQFRFDGVVRARAVDHPVLGTYTLGEWCYVEIVLDTVTDQFDIEVSGPGVDGVLEATGLEFEEPLDEVSFIEVYDDSPPLNDFGLDDICLGTDPPTATLTTTWGRIRTEFR